jgi:hypothetical protein
VVPEHGAEVDVAAARAVRRWRRGRCEGGGAAGGAEVAAPRAVRLRAGWVSADFRAALPAFGARINLAWADGPSLG